MLFIITKKISFYLPHIFTMESEDNSDAEFEEVVIMGVISEYIEKYIHKIPCRTLKLTGELWVQDVLNGHPRRYQEQFRMSASIFLSLEKWISTHTEIRNLRKHEGISIMQKLAIFLWITGHGASNRDAQEQFQHSGETISRYIFILKSVTYLKRS